MATVGIVKGIVAGFVNPGCPDAVLSVDASVSAHPLAPVRGGERPKATLLRFSRSITAYLFMSGGWYGLAAYIFYLLGDNVAQDTALQFINILYLRLPYLAQARSSAIL